MKLRWLYNRLMAMSPAEVVWRFREQAKRARAKGRLEGWERFADANPAAPVLPVLREALDKAAQPDRAEIAQAAARILDGHFSALGVTWPRRDPADLYPVDRWSMDPVTGKSWPEADYCFNIGYRHNQAIGDVKYVWEFGRLQSIATLAAAYRLDRSPEALRAIESAITSWAQANPPFRGVHYAEILNVAMRAISVVFASSLCGEDFAPETVRVVRQLLRSHLLWLRLFPSRYSSANNHLIAELAAEYLTALALGDADLRHHADHCWAQLIAEAEKQILPDGINAEQSPTYGAYTAEFLLLAALVAQGDGKSVPALLRERLLAFADQIFWLADAQGRVANLGDNDEGRVLTHAAHEPTYALSVATAICGFFGTKPATKAQAAPALRLALLGRPAAQGSPHAGLHVFEQGGLSVLRGPLGGKACILTFDHGPLGYLSIAAHGHADALSITLSVEGQPLLVDPGTYLYHSGGAWRSWFRGTPAHNTLSIAQRNQSTISGPFGWSVKAKSWLEQAQTGAKWQLTGRHDGYDKPFGVQHQRSLEPSTEGLRITDQLIGKTLDQPVELVFQLAPDVEVTIAGLSATLSREGQTVAILRWNAPGEVHCASGGEIGEGGWVSSRFGEKAPAPRLVWRGAMPAEGIVTDIALSIS